MSKELNPADFNNELEYVEAVLGFKLDESNYKLNKEGKLVRLKIIDKGISNIKFIEKLTSLTTLDLYNNQIQYIEALSGLTSLTLLSLSANQIQDIEALSGLTSLSFLYLSNNQIQDLEVLSGLTSLIYLNLYGNQIQDIEALSELTSLTELSLSNNQIQDIKSLSELTSLKELSLSSNQIQDIESLSGLISLKKLDISYNQIQDIKAFSGLTLLKYLYISFNQIQDLKALSGLTSLKKLYLDNNQIQDLEALSGLTSLTSLYLSNNPIKNIPETILNSSAQEIVRWLQLNENAKATNEEKVLLHDIKVLLLGNTNIGKSNLLSYWEQWYKDRKITNLYPINSETTHGLVYKELQKKGIETPLLHIWDFGGQEYFHATHQLFFSPQALHVLLWTKDMTNTRIKGEQIFELDYWLRCSEQLSKHDSPIEMVLIENRIDHTDENDNLEFYSHFPDDHYLEKFNIHSPHKEKDTSRPPFMLNTCSVSLLHQKRLEGMFELLDERIEMLHQKNLHPPIYAEIRDGLEKSTKKFWTLAEYKKKFNQEDNTILKTLHKLGCILYFHKRLPNKIFTQPELLLELIYNKILNENLQKQQGKLTDELKKAGKDNELGLTALELQKLLSDFKLIFKTHDDCWYAPQYLPEASPAWLQLLKDYTFGVANIKVSSDRYLMNNILLDLFTEYADVIKKDDSYMFWQKGLVIQKDGQLLLIEYDRKQMCLLLYGDQQEKNRALQKEVVDFIIEVIHKDGKPSYELESMSEEVDRIGFKNHELKLKGEKRATKNSGWRSDKVNIGVSIDGNYYVNVQQLHDNVLNKIYLHKELQGTMKKVTISYSKDDLKLVNEFIKNLVPLHDDGLIENPWYCSQLEAGTEWNKEIQEKFNQADIIFFMVSPNFLATKYIKEHEIKTAIARRQKEIEEKLVPSKQVKIIPIILDFCRWNRKDAKYNLGKYTALPYTAKPVMDFKNRSMAWYIIEEAIRVAIEKDNDPDFNNTLSKEVQKIYERIMARKVDDDNDISD
ncbi:Leucine-rich repeat (LRR) protein [Kordia periserrulae]|uniref:Leucine-rich repeat (LRR) protein n=1 Tax=Kordia periserrulae TaxID=701523 RepID=A0A2T6C013_9FLAO|nr:leucine-rich repeat domain-containing protein [Kordia periserrulae]PTX61655.1 Leucine-rich repeat (LRR) protein [Kordia periserrulae]